MTEPVVTVRNVEFTTRGLRLVIFTNNTSSSKNAPPRPDVVQALWARTEYPSALMREHVAWALAEQAAKNGEYLTKFISKISQKS